MKSDIKLKLQTYSDLLKKWQKTVNLVAPSTLAQAWERHFEDSLQLLELIPANAVILADIGSGAGFPGLVLGIARPDIEVHLIESDSKKGTFLLTVSRETGASNVHVHVNRIESVLPNLKSDVVTARALSALPNLIDMTRSQWERESPALLLFPKGEDWQNEVKETSKDYDLAYTAQPSKTGRGAAILCINAVKPLTSKTPAR